MKILKLVLICICLINFSPFVFAQESPQSKTLSSKFLLFIGQDKDSIQEYIKQTGQIPDGFMGYTSIQNVEGLYEPKDSGGGTQYLDFFVKEYPKAKLQIGLYMVSALDDILKGRYDENINKLSDWFKKAGLPIFLRIGYECDGPHNNYDPVKYVEVFKYLVNKFKTAGVKNVSYVWHSYGGYVEGDRFRWYPGDDYVDWIGVSYFDAYNNANMKKIVQFAQSRHKPFMIAEATPRGFKTSDADKVWNRWFEKLFAFVRENNVEALSYINTNWEAAPLFQGQNWGDSRIEQNELIKEKWLSEFNR